MQLFLNGLTVTKVLDQIICYLFLILFIWGANIKFGKKDQFNDDHASLDAMKSLREIGRAHV